MGVATTVLETAATAGDGSTDGERADQQSIAPIDPKAERAFSNAYVSGMKEDLKLNGNQLNYFTTYFNIGYMIMLYPSCILTSHLGPSVWLPTCEIIWGVLTCCLSTVSKAEQVYGLRFLIGFFEGTTWPAYFTIISQWYLPHEIALRMSLYNIAQPAGAMISGATQGALSAHMDGTLGRAGWRWAFIINGVCTIGIALAAFFILPGYPERPNPLTKYYLKPRHIEIALARAKRVGRKAQTGITPKSFARAFSFWQFWAFAIAWPIGGNTTPASFFNLWLKSLKTADGTKKYTVAQLNYIPIAGQAILLICEIVFSGLGDLLGVRLPFLLLHSVINIKSLSILSVKPKSESLYFAGWFLDYVGGVSMMLLLAWASAHLQSEPEVRTILSASGTVFAYLMNAFIPLAVYPAKEAPNWKIGAWVYLAFSIVSTGLFIAIWFGFRWEAKKKAAKVEGSERTRSEGEERVAVHALAYFEDKP